MTDLCKDIVGDHRYENTISLDTKHVSENADEQRQEKRSLTDIEIVPERSA